MSRANRLTRSFPPPQQQQPADSKHSNTAAAGAARSRHRAEPQVHQELPTSLASIADEVATHLAIELASVLDYPFQVLMVAVLLPLAAVHPTDQGQQGVHPAAR